jgi:hypothetical protein
MSDELVTVASYRAPVVAQLALGRLKDEGIEAFLTGEGAVDTFAGVSGLGGPMQLQVHAPDLERARALLAEVEGHVNPDWETEVETDEGIWLCSLCGQPVELDEDVCPACQTPREAVRTERSTTLPRRPPPAQSAEAIERRDQMMTGPPPIPEHELTEDAVDIPPAETFLADDLARRAFRAAVFGAMTPICGVFSLYSVWLSLRLCFMPGELTPQNSQRLRWALLINGLIGLGWVVVYGIFWRPWF